MRGVIQRIISEPGAASPAQFARRVRLLAVTYVLLFLASATGVVLLALYGKLFVTLAQRSNVETLTIVFMLIFYGYLCALSAPGALGAARIVLRRGMPAFGPPHDGIFAAVDLLLGTEPLRFPLLQGALGAISVDGARVQHVGARDGGSADLIAYFIRQLVEVTGQDVTIVSWGHLDDDGAARFLSQVAFARNLGAKLGAPLWPQVALTAAHVAALQQRLDALGDALIDDALLPDWEYSAEHKLPVIPEPLGIVSLGLSAKRADPLPTMAFALFVVLATLAIVVLFILRPPWVPG